MKKSVTKKPKASAETSTIKFSKSDFPHLASVIESHPELKICALALKTARALKLKFPLKTHNDLVPLLRGEIAAYEGHIMRAATIRKYFVIEDFPIENEEQFIGRIHVALWRARTSMSSSFAAGPLNFSTGVSFK